MAEIKSQITITRPLTVSVKIDNVGTLDFQGQLSATPAGIFNRSNMQVSLEGQLNLTGTFARLMDDQPAAEQKKAPVQLGLGLCKCPCGSCAFCEFAPCPKCSKTSDQCDCDGEPFRTI